MGMSTNPSFIAGVMLQQEPVISEIQKVVIFIFHNDHKYNTVLNETKY